MYIKCWTRFSKIVLHPPFLHPYPVYLDGVGQRDSDGEWQPLRNSNHQNGNANNEELDKVLDVDGSAFSYPGATLDPKGVNHKEENKDDDGHS